MSIEQTVMCDHPVVYNPVTSRKTWTFSTVLKFWSHPIFAKLVLELQLLKCLVIDGWHDTESSHGIIFKDLPTVRWESDKRIQEREYNTLWYGSGTEPVLRFAWYYLSKLSADILQPMVERLTHGLHEKLLKASLRSDVAYIVIATALLEAHGVPCGTVLTQSEAHSNSVLHNIFGVDSTSRFESIEPYLTSHTIARLPHEHWQYAANMAIRDQDPEKLAKLYDLALSSATSRPEHWQWSMLWHYNGHSTAVLDYMLRQALSRFKKVGTVPVIHDATLLSDLVTLLASKCTRLSILLLVHKLICYSTCDTIAVAFEVLCRRMPHTSYQPLQRLLLHWIFRPSFCHACQDTRFLPPSTAVVEWYHDPDDVIPYLWYISEGKDPRVECPECAIKGSTTCAQFAAKKDYWLSRESPTVSEALPRMPDCVLDIVKEYCGFPPNFVEFLVRDCEDDPQRRWAPPFWWEVQRLRQPVE
jgi:hypothetical protein